MGAFGPVDWQGVFLPKTPLVEIFVRGTLVYSSLFLLLRVILKRQSGTLGVGDLLVIVLIADAAQNAMAGNYTSVPDGIVLVATIIFWSFTLDWLGYHFPWFGRFIHPPPLELVRDGRMLRRNMRLELISPEELMGELRLQGVSDLREVKRACMEGNGEISVLRVGDGGLQPKKKRKAV